MDRKKWEARVWTEFHAGRLNHIGRDVLLTLATYCGSGIGWPSHQTLADATEYSTRSVRRWLAVAHEVGLVMWNEVRWRAGSIWRRGTNRYRLTMPFDAVPKRPERRPKVSRQKRAEADRARADARAMVPGRPPKSLSTYSGPGGRGGESTFLTPLSVAEQLRALGLPVKPGSGSPAFREAMGW